LTVQNETAAGKILRPLPGVGRRDWTRTNDPHHVKVIQGDRFEGQLIENYLSPFVPLGDGGGNRERPFAKDGEIGEAAIRYAFVQFLPELHLCSGSRHSMMVGQ
jgi:hypothetical protein